MLGCEISTSSLFTFLFSSPFTLTLSFSFNSLAFAFKFHFHCCFFASYSTFLSLFVRFFLFLNPVFSSLLFSFLFFFLYCLLAPFLPFYLLEFSSLPSPSFCLIGSSVFSLPPFLLSLLSQCFSSLFLSQTNASIFSLLF